MFPPFELIACSRRRLRRSSRHVNALYVGATIANIGKRIGFPTIGILPIRVAPPVVEIIFRGGKTVLVQGPPKVDRVSTSRSEVSTFAAIESGLESINGRRRSVSAQLNVPIGRPVRIARLQRTLI